MARPWDVYAKRLSPLGYGHPLWIPEPSREYGEVHIGDVGFFLDGRFRFLFNCTREANDPLNLRGTPIPFRRFTIPPGSVVENPHEITQPLLQSQGMHSVSAQGQGTIGDPTLGDGARAALRYRCTEQSGALLMLNQAGYATRLDCTRAVQRYMIQNLEHWYLFATDRLGIDLRENELIFVYGHIKTTVWAEAAFTSSSTDSELSISANVPVLGASGELSVELSNRHIPTIFHRQGPRGRITAGREMDAVGTLPGASVEDAFDQCIFLNYFKMKRRFLGWVMLRAAAGPHELPPSPPDDLPREISEEEDSNEFDVASQILDHILGAVDDVDYAWISDQDICRTLRQRTTYQDSPSPLSQGLNVVIDWTTIPQARIVTDHGLRLGSLTWQPDPAGHNIDTPRLLPKDALPMRLDSSLDGGAASQESRRVRFNLPRSNSKTVNNKDGIYSPHMQSLASPEDSGTAVAFPRSVSGKHSLAPPEGEFVIPSTLPNDLKMKSSSALGSGRPLLPRAHFQSEIDAASARKLNMNSDDELGTRPWSMPGRTVKLGVGEIAHGSMQFKLSHCIGGGQFGAVYKALNLGTGYIVAIKRIRLEGLTEDDISQLKREVDLVKSLWHPNIINYEGVTWDDSSLNIVLEYAEKGSLRDTLDAVGQLSERLVNDYVDTILRGLSYLHKNNIVHGNLKAANILTTKIGNIKLSSFGISLNLRALKREIKDVVVTPNWMAPEVIKLRGASTKSDIWSLACTIIELLTGRPPYADIADIKSVMSRIVDDERPPLPEDCSENLQRFLKWCLNKKPYERPDSGELHNHEWLKNHHVARKERRTHEGFPFSRGRYLGDLETSGPRNSSPRRMLSNDPDPISLGKHCFVETTFRMPVICNVCRRSVERNVVLCETCNLTAHVWCTGNTPPAYDRYAPPACDRYAKRLPPLARYADSDNSTDILAAAGQGEPPASPISQTSDGSLSQRASAGSIQPHTTGQQDYTAHPSTAIED